MAKRPPSRFLEDVPRPSASSVMEAFYGGDQSRRQAREVPVELIEPNPGQPRRLFDTEQLAELTDSIRELGLIQPIVLRPVESKAGERYQIVCGERRFRACTALGKPSVRAEVREIDDETAYKLALAENVQRNSLTSVEEALAYRQLLAQKMSQAEIARSLGIDRRRVSEKLLLLDLPGEAQELLSARADTFTERHARLLAQAPAGSIDVVELAKLCAARSWSTRQLEAEIAQATRSEEPTAPRLFENIHYALNKRGGFTLTVRARSRQEVARTIAELEDKLRELREAFAADLGRVSARADSLERSVAIDS